MTDITYTEGFPKGWSMIHRPDATLLVTKDWQGLTIALCSAPALCQGEAWLEKAKFIAHACSHADNLARQETYDEYCDHCGSGPHVDEHGRNLPNSRAHKSWTCDNCGTVNIRPKEASQINKSPAIPLTKTKFR